MTRRDGRLLAFLFLASAALFLHPFALGRTHVAGDVLYSFQPWLTYAAQELQRGSLPLWNPYATCGEPFLANPQVMVFFPPAQLFWMFGFADAWRLHLLAEEALLLLAAYLLARRSGRPGAALAGLSAAWGGLTVMLWEFPGALATVPLVFLTLLFARRARAVGAVPFAAALLFFAGYTQFAYYALLAGAGLSARRPGRLALYAAAAAAGALLALPQILPAWEAARHSLRAGVDATAARQFLLTPVFLVKFLLPDFHDKASLPYRAAAFSGDLWPVARSWLNTFYVGLPALALAAAGLRRRTAAWAALGAAGILLALGVEPFFSLFRLVPGARYMTHFSNAILMTVAALTVLAAEGAGAWAERKNAARTWGGFLLLAALAVAAFPAARTALAQGIFGREAFPALTAAQDAMARASAVKAAAVLAAFLAVTALPRGKWLLVLALALADLWAFGRDVHPFFSSGFFREPLPLARRLQGTDARLSLEPRAMRENDKPMDGATMEEGYQSLRQALFPNIALPFRVPHTWAYEVFADSRFADVRRAMPAGRPLGPIMDFLGARHVLAARPLGPPARFLGQRPNILLYENPGALPRVGWVPAARAVSDEKERLAWMASGWKPREELILEGGESGRAAGPLETLSWRESPGRLEAEGRSGGGWLVYSEVDRPGWEAYVNGRKVALLRADHAFQAAALPSGDWRAVFLYRPGFAIFGFAAAAALWAALSAAGLAFLRRS